MKRLQILLMLGLFLILSSTIWGAVPQLINFQGILRDGSGNPVANGSYSVQFKIYIDSTGGIAYWSETQTVTTTNGLFSVLLGDSTPVPDATFNNLDLWLGVKVGADPEMTPRQRLVSGAYSFRVAHFIPDFGSDNTFIGRNAGNLTMTGGGNTASGSGALQLNTTGGLNTASGVGALGSNTTGESNTAGGTNALVFNTTGNFNTASGAEALRNNTTGSLNTASGYQALYGNTFFGNSGSYNTASGYNALRNNTTGSENTASGAAALQSNINGYYNTASGGNALFNNSTGSSNTAVGHNALLATTASDFNTAIGANAGSSFNNGYNNVFVGANVDVTGPGFYNVIAIGQATPVGASSTALFGNAATVSYGGWAGWTNVSDGRYKKNVRENVPGIEFIKKLRPITYNLDATGLDAFYRKNDNPERPRTSPAKALHERALREKEQIVYTGFVAQEVEAAARTLGFDFSGVDAAKNGNEVYGLRYAEFVVPLVKAVQELGEENAELKTRIEQLEKQLKKMQAEKPQAKAQ